MRTYLQHGSRHVGANSDPITLEWVYVGSGGGAPAFQNSWGNVGGTYAPLRFRFAPGVDPDTDQPVIHIQGSFSGGTAGTTIFTLPIPLDYDVHLAGSDDSGGFLCITVQQSGDVVDGFV